MSANEEWVRVGWLFVWPGNRECNLQARVRCYRLPWVEMMLGHHATVNRQNLVVQEGEWVSWLFLWSERLQLGAVADELDMGSAQTSVVGEVLQHRYFVKFLLQNSAKSALFREGSERVWFSCGREDRRR